MTTRGGVDLDRLVDVQVADVYKGDRLAAELRRTEDGVSFTYLADYLSSDQPRPVATTLPLTDEPQGRPGGAVPPFFAGLLPEGRRLSGLRRAIKTSADDELSLLLAVGADVVGDIRVLPQGDEYIDPKPLVSVDRDFSEVTFADVLGDSGVVDPVGLPGVQDKGSARMISLPVAQSGKRFILKVDPPEYPHVVVNEAYFIGLAHRAKFPAVSARVVHDATGRPGLLVERFDRVGGPGGSTMSLAVEDATQVLGKYPADKYRVSAEEVAVALAQLCPARLPAARDVFRQFCLAWLTGNGDVHGKNVSIYAPGGEWRVAPAYDLPSTVPYGDRTLALSIGGKKDGLSRRLLLEFAGRIGLREAAASRVLDDVLVATEPTLAEIRDGALPFDTRVTADTVAVLRHRRLTATTS